MDRTPCTTCGATAFDSNIHCDSCPARVCASCDPRKQQCASQDARNVCGAVRCGACRDLPGAREWAICMGDCSCFGARVACTSCTDLGKEIGAKHGMPEEVVMCAACVAANYDAGDY